MRTAGNACSRQLGVLSEHGWCVQELATLQNVADFPPLGMAVQVQVRLQHLHTCRRVGRPCHRCLRVPLPVAACMHRDCIPGICFRVQGNPRCQADLPCAVLLRVMLSAVKHAAPAALLVSSCG